MIELLRMATAVLKNGTFGVNANIAALTLNAGDARPPNVANILEPSTAHTQIRDELLAAGPYVICDVEAPRPGAGQQFCNVIDYTADLMVGYFAHLGNDYLLRTQAEYTMRAICQAFDAGWFTAVNRPIYGRLNGLGVMACTRRTIEVFDEHKYGSNIAGRVRYELQIRDLNP